MDRRRFLKIGGSGLVATALAHRLGLTVARAASPTVTPFERALTTPPVAVATSTTGGVDLYEIELRQADIEILTGTRTSIYGYGGLFPGPTIRATVGRAIHVDFSNSLPVPAAIHLHGGHVAPQHDGHPMDLIEPGTTRRYEYPNAQLGATLWYHDHAMDRTAENVYRGLAGLYLLHDPTEDELGLPTGDRDVPLLIQDRTFAADGSLSYPEPGDPRRHDGVTGDVFLVNGVPFPKLAVERGRYRFRIVNGSNTRAYELRLAGGRSMTQIGSDGGLLAAPVPVTSVTLGIAERAEVIIDFSTFDAGAPVELQDGLSGRAVMRFDVGSSGAAGAAPPSVLRTIAALPEPTTTRELQLSFDGSVQQWVINGRPFDEERIDFRPRLGETERWRITNTSSFVHPFHLHLVMFQVLKRGLTNPPPAERGWKDTVRVGPNETVELAARFTGHTGTYVFHCHILEHEDHAMMGQLRVVDLSRLAGADRTATAAAISQATTTPGSEVFVATGDAFADALAGGPAAAANGAPVLLVRGSALSEATRAELTRLEPRAITVLGGTAAVADAVVDELGDFGPVRRVAGRDRYETAALLADLVPAPRVVYIATGVAFADALVGGAAVAAEGGALLLTAPAELPAVTADALRRHRPARVVILGGTAAVSATVEEQLRQLDIGTIERRAGADRYETAAAITSAAFPATVETAYVATGASFADALAATPAAATAGAPLLLSGASEVPPATVAELRRLSPTRIVIIGGDGAVGTAAEEQLAGLL